MTVIVAYRDGHDCYMACDTQVTTDTVTTFVESKIIRFKIYNEITEKYIECLVGVSGYAYMLNFLQHGFKIPKIQNNQSFNNYLNNQFIKELNKQLQQNNIVEVNNSEIRTGGNILIAYDNIYMLDYNNASITIDTPIYAIGSGASYALGSMHGLIAYNFDNIDIETMLSISVDAAKIYDPNCGGDNIIESITISDANDN